MKKPGIIMLGGAVVVWITLLCLLYQWRRAKFDTKFSAPRKAIAEFNRTNNQTIKAPDVTRPKGPDRSKLGRLAKLRTGPQSMETFADMSSKFESKLKPALLAWAKAYEGRVPFPVEDLTIDRFIERVGEPPNCEYEFFVDGVTVGIEDKNGSVHVSYLSSRGQMNSLIRMPSGMTGPAGDALSVPLSKEEILQMVRLDSGQDYPANEVYITPTGISGSMRGGAYVRIGKNPNDSLRVDYDYVFDPHGKLAYYFKGIYTH